MKTRTTQALFGVFGVLLVANLFRLAPPVAHGQASEAGQVPAVLRARMFELVDEKGRTRAQLKVEPGGEAVFRMRDARGTIRIKLGASEDGCGLLLLDDNTEPAIHLLAKRTGTALTLAEKGKEKRVLTP